MSTVKINQGAINRFFAQSPFAGAGVGGVRGGQAVRIAARMVTLVEREARKDFRSRSGDLFGSFRPIVRPDPRGGTRIGVGSTSKTAEYLTDGTRPHKIGPRSRQGGKKRYLMSRPEHPSDRRPLTEPVYVVKKHPGNKPNDFIRRGVNLAIGRPLP